MRVARPRTCAVVTSWLLALTSVVGSAAAAESPVDFGRDIRPILSNTCFACHGPDEKQRQAGLRLDEQASMLGELESGSRAVVPGKPDQSELVRRITADDPDERMPPADSSKKLTPRDVDLLRRWVAQGAPFARHWAYVRPVRPPLPEVADKAWPHNGIDYFILARLQQEGLAPSPTADRYALVRRVALDLTGLPPTLEEVDRFVADTAPGAYERLVDRLLEKQAYGEHWARKWLDLARYADSAGYADDPPRVIWAYRDWVIRALNANMPFDEFTIEQLAGDLVPDPTDDQLIATAFHRNTMTNNEGGTNDEEFRNVAIVDRVNTTMAVWMGTTMACAQCHNHKFDPISQEEYFRFFAIFNNTADADRRDESPLLSIYTPEQRQQQRDWEEERARLETALRTPTPDLAQSQRRWEERVAPDLTWQVVRPAAVRSAEGAPITQLDDGSVLVGEAHKTDVTTVDLPLDAVDPLTEGTLTAVRLESLPDASLPGKGAGYADGNFMVTRVMASLVPDPKAPDAKGQYAGRYVRVEIPGKQKILSLAELQVASGGANIAPAGEASQSSTAFNGPAKLAIDGNTDGNFAAGTTTHTATMDDPWWEVDLKSTQPVESITLFNRTDGNVGTRLAGFQVSLLDDQRKVVWQQKVAEAPNPSRKLDLVGRDLPIVAAYADFAQSGFEASGILETDKPNEHGWAVGGRVDQPHALTLMFDKPATLVPHARLRLVIDQLSSHANHTLGRFRISASMDERAGELAASPAEALAIARIAPVERSDAQQAELTRIYLGQIAPELKEQRARLAALKQQLAELKPAIAVPILRELDEAHRRTTHIQHRGNFLDLGKEVTPGLPAAFPAPPAGAAIDRLALARWLVSEDNPLTARVVVNRYWEAIFGQGLVRTSEEFGSQGELPSHPELLDWLATELMRSGWNVKALAKLVVTSAAYRQSSRVTPELLERDPENRLLARGPRFRLSAEMIRDQALFVSGLLSEKMYGPPVKPPQPKLGVNAAFGSGIDWQTSDGEDRFRRGLYTTWRRSNPYPSMVTFDAPNREVCTIRRAQTNTPLQALVTLNDPVYIEAAQALARRMMEDGTSTPERATLGFRLCLGRPPEGAELAQLVQLYGRAYQRYAAQPEQAKQMAGDPSGKLPLDVDPAEAAAWTVVGNVLLNLDEMFMKR